MKRMKNALAILLFLLLALGVGYFFFHNWLVRQPWEKKDLFDAFSFRMDEKYAGEQESVRVNARVRMENNDYLIVMLGSAKDGEEAYYEFYKSDERAPGDDLWNGPMKKGYIHKGDQMVSFSHEFKNQSEQWGYVFFQEDAAEVIFTDDGEEKRVEVKAGVPTPIVTEAPPEELQINLLEK